MPNELVSATSQYLLDHANDLVEWQEWGEAALEVARSANTVSYTHLTLPTTVFV